ncbi:hypothetical protein BD309DRAFT_984756, partial [Dichomitus squalens]
MGPLSGWKSQRMHELEHRVELQRIVAPSCCQALRWLVVFSKEAKTSLQLKSTSSGIAPGIGLTQNPTSAVTSIGVALLTRSHESTKGKLHAELSNCPTTCVCHKVHDRWPSDIPAFKATALRPSSPSTTPLSLAHPQHDTMTPPDVEPSSSQMGDASESTPGQRQERGTSNEAHDSVPASSQQVKTEVLNTQGIRGVSSAPLPWKLPNIEDLKKEFAETYTQADKDKALSETAKVVKTYSDEMVKRWNEEIDNLLVYAGLFSSILTAFNVQSYLLLQPTTPDPTIAVLQQISLQLNSFSVNPPGALVNSTHPVTPFAAVQTSLSLLHLRRHLSQAMAARVPGWHLRRLGGIRMNSPIPVEPPGEVARCGDRGGPPRPAPDLPLPLLLWPPHPTLALSLDRRHRGKRSHRHRHIVCGRDDGHAQYLVQLLLPFPPTFAIFPIVQHTKPIVFPVFVYAICFPFYLLFWGLAKFALLPHRARSWFEDLANSISQAVSYLRLGQLLISWCGLEQYAVQHSSFSLDLDMMIHAYSTTINVNHLSATAVAILAGQGANTEAIDRCLHRIRDINQRHLSSEDILVDSVDFWAGMLCHGLEKASIHNLYFRSESCRDNMKSGDYERLLPALAATLANPDSGTNAHSLSLLSSCHGRRSAMLTHTITVAAAVEMQLRQLLHPSDGEPAQEPDWDTVLWLRILVQCCFAPVSSWTRSDEETEVSMACIFGMGILQKGSISKIARKLRGGIPVKAMLEALDIILTNLGKGTSRIVERQASGKSWPWDDDDVQEALKKLKDSSERCKSLGLGVRAEGSIQASPPDPKPSILAASAVSPTVTHEHSRMEAKTEVYRYTNTIACHGAPCYYVDSRVTDCERAAFDRVHSHYERSMRCTRPKWASVLHPQPAIVHPGGQLSAMSQHGGDPTCLQVYPTENSHRTLTKKGKGYRSCSKHKEAPWFECPTCGTSEENMTLAQDAGEGNAYVDPANEGGLLTELAKIASWLVPQQQEPLRRVSSYEATMHQENVTDLVAGSIPCGGIFFAAAAPTNKYLNLGMNLNRDLEDLAKYLVLGQVDPPDLAKSIGLGVLEVLGILE